MREMFARGLLDWLGISPNFAAIGKYKDAANIFTEKDFTAGAARRGRGAGGRHVRPDRRHGRKPAPSRTRRRSRAYRPGAAQRQATGSRPICIDRLEYDDQFDDRIKDYGGHDHAIIEYTDYKQVPLLPALRHRDRIAVIYGDRRDPARRRAASIRCCRPAATQWDRTTWSRRSTRRARTTRVRAVVFRINSPGGSVIASETDPARGRADRPRKSRWWSACRATPPRAATGSRRRRRRLSREPGDHHRLDRRARRQVQHPPRLTCDSASTPAPSRAAPTPRCSTHSAISRPPSRSSSTTRSWARPTSTSSSSWRIGDI